MKVDVMLICFKFFVVLYLHRKTSGGTEEDEWEVWRIGNKIEYVSLIKCAIELLSFYYFVLVWYGFMLMCISLYHVSNWNLQFVWIVYSAKVAHVLYNMNGKVYTLATIFVDRKLEKFM